MSFIGGTQVELLYSLAAPVTKNTYTTTAAISALAASANVATIPGGMLAVQDPNPVGRAFYLKAAGTIANAATGNTFFPSLVLSTTPGTSLNPIAIYPTTAPTASTTCQWEMEAWITCQAAGLSGGTTFQVNGNWHQGIVASGLAITATSLWAQFAGNLTGYSASAPTYVELFGTWSGSSASATTTVQQMFLFGLN